MSASVAEQILARVSTALQAAPSLAITIVRNRLSAFGQDELPSINIKRLSDEETAHANGLTRHLLIFEIDILVAGENWETGTDALHVAAHNRLLADVTLSGLGHGLICTGSELAGGEAEYTCGRLTAQYQMQFLTRPGDLTRAIN